MAAVLAHGARWATRTRKRPTQAVHELRKSIRRARALLALSEPLLPARRLAALDGRLRQAQAATSTLRDTDVLLQSLRGDLGLQPNAAQKRFLAAFATSLRRQQREARGVIAGTVSGSGPVLGEVASGYARALPARVKWADVERGLRGSYQRTRHRQRRARHDARDDERFHRWRKSVKALNYQLELLASTGAEPARKARREIADLAEGQGRITDLMLLLRRLRAAAGPTPDQDTTGLLRRLKSVVDRRRRKVLRSGKQALARPPGRFVHLLA